MDDSDLIIHSVKTSYLSCCYYKDTTIFVSSNLSLDLFDFVTGTKISSLIFQEEQSPLSMTVIKRRENICTILLQDKSGLISVIDFDELTSCFKIVNQYHIEMIGFTKLPLVEHSIDLSGKLFKEIKDSFITLNYPNCIEVKTIDKGKLKQQFEVQKQEEFTDVTFMLKVSFHQQSYVIVAEEGAILKKIKLPSQGDYIDSVNKLVLQTKKQIKVILWIEVFNNFRALISLREDKITQIDLRTFSLVRSYDFTFGRIIKNIEFNHQFRFILVGKSKIMIMEKQKPSKCQTIHTSLILDSELCEYGIFGICQEGKIFFLPFDIKS